MNTRIWRLNRLFSRDRSIVHGISTFGNLGLFLYMKCYLSLPVWIVTFSFVSEMLPFFRVRFVNFPKQFRRADSRQTRCVSAHMTRCVSAYVCDNLSNCSEMQVIIIYILYVHKTVQKLNVLCTHFCKNEMRPCFQCGCVNVYFPFCTLFFKLRTHELYVTAAFYEDR